MCQAVDVVPALPRCCGRQRHRDNTPAKDALMYYRRCITIPLLDHLLVELESRFSHLHPGGTTGALPSAFGSGIYT